MFADDFNNACVVEDRNVFFLADFKKSFNVGAASRADRITGAFIKTAVDLIDVILEFDAVVFEPLNAFRSFFCELVNQDRVAASVTGSQSLFSMKFGRVGNAGFFVIGFNSCIESAAGTNRVTACEHHFFKNDDFLSTGFFSGNSCGKTRTAGTDHDDVISFVPFDGSFCSGAEEGSENTGSGSSFRSGTKEYST